MSSFLYKKIWHGISIHTRKCIPVNPKAFAPRPHPICFPKIAIIISNIIKKISFYIPLKLILNPILTKNTGIKTAYPIGSIFNDNFSLNFVSEIANPAK